MNQKITRIRYKQLEDGTLESPVFMASDELVKINLNYTTLSYSVSDIKGNVKTTGSSKTVPAMKLAAKKAVQALGVVFLDEIRTTKTKGDENV